MPSIKLSEENKAIVERLREGLAEVMNDIESHDSAARRALSRRINDLGLLAHRLHMALAQQGTPPKHHKYMIDNRGVAADHPDFYKHVHPIEDLLKFVGDSSANDDPVDQTIGKEFSLRVFSRRWGHEDTYRVTRTDEGWHVAHIAISGKCDRAGTPFLYTNLAQDNISYPSSLPFMMEQLWDSAADRGLSVEAVQQAFDQLGTWISGVERTRPTGGPVWES